jgi:hypothetical protein
MVADNFRGRTSEPAGANGRDNALGRGAVGGGEIDCVALAGRRWAPGPNGVGGEAGERAPLIAFPVVRSSVAPQVVMEVGRVLSFGAPLLRSGTIRRSI